MSLDDSPFFDRLNTNYIPSDPEILEIRALLVDPTGELARVGAQIEAMEIALSQLKERRELLKRPIDAHRALISPMRRAPEDVLREIFLFCLPSEHNALIDPAEAPLILGHICRHWRTIVYSTPILWSSIHIPCDIPRSVSPKLERVVETWLERSGSCSLSISVGNPDGSGDPNLKNHPLIRRLLPISRRLYSLEIFGTLDFIRPLVQLGSQDVPLLKHIAIRTNRPDQPFDVLHAPALEDVSLNLASSTDPLSYPLRWSLLTGLNLECYPSWNPEEGGLDSLGALNVLRRCPNIVRCELRITRRVPFGTSVDISPIILPQIHSLVITGLCHSQEWSSHWVVPKLRYLQVGDSAFADATSHTGDGMTAHINLNEFTSSSLQQLLRSFPMISHLRLSPEMVCGYPDSPLSLDDAFLAFFYPPHDLCPILTDVAITAPSAGFSDAAALAFIKARMTMAVPLQHFCVQFDRPLEVDIIPDLQPFISGGLRVELEYPTPAWEFDARAGLY
ncbi:hypothetical protein DFH08DRAFT_190981 [Mycena albidolilacea]|uniref:F-box domain-containing protein n=1 Tax=Mycena albidolilacea TaxID=1033008 RepID=A0AAD7F5G1_9AGAR|nr:hypothetical protein DFH08DRAFT_190981 [Mycena albidolilacea]